MDQITQPVSLPFNGTIIFNANSDSSPAVPSTPQETGTDIQESEGGEDLGLGKKDKQGRWVVSREGLRPKDSTEYIRQKDGILMKRQMVSIPKVMVMKLENEGTAIDRDVSSIITELIAAHQSL